MILIDIPGVEKLEIEHLVSDFSGTLSENGLLIQGVKERINRLAESVKIHVLTSDTFNAARKQLSNVQCQLHILEGSEHDAQKERYIEELGREKVVAMGNGNNDRLMLKIAKVGISVCLKEGCATSAARASDIMVISPLDALDLLLVPKRMIAILRA